MGNQRQGESDRNQQSSQQQEKQRRAEKGSSPRTDDEVAEGGQDEGSIATPTSDKENRERRGN